MAPIDSLLFVVKPVNIFWLTYSVTLLSGIFFMVVWGLRQKYPPATWISLVAAVMVFFVIGLKLFAYSWAEWVMIFTGRLSEASHMKYAPGGLLLVALGIVVVRRFLKFSAPVFDGMVIFLPLLGAFQRMGCFLNGCCYGTVTDVPWAVHYAGPSALFFNHYDQGLLEAGQTASLGVHPTQLYTIVGNLIVLGILIWTRRRFRAPGSRTLFALLLLGGFRFVLEFFREPGNTLWAQTYWQSLNLLQLAILLLMGVFGYILWRKERSGQKAVIAIPAEQLLRSTGVVLFLFLLLWQVRSIMDGMELLLLYPFLIGALAFLGIRLFHEITTPVSRGVVASMLFIAFLSMSQTVYHAAQEGDEQRNKGWFSFGPSGGVGAYEEVSTNCSGDVIGRDRRDFTVYGGSASWHYMSRADRHLEAGIRSYYIEDRINHEYYYDKRFMSFNPFVSYDMKYAGGSLGLIYRKEIPPEEVPGYEGGIKFFPSFSIWAGKRDLVFAEMELWNRYSYVGPAGVFQIGMGFPLGEFNSNVIRAGLAVNADSRTGVYLGGEWLIKRDVTLAPMFTYNRYPSFSINMQWHLGKNRWTPVKKMPVK
jgi:prolipoprotein diacylglyceryltransferase